MPSKTLNFDVAGMKERVINMLRKGPDVCVTGMKERLIIH